MNGSALNKQAVLLSAISKRRIDKIAVIGQKNNRIGNKKSCAKGFAPVEITDLPQAESNRIEVLFPSGVRVVLAGPHSLACLTSLIKQGF
ncbi:MAG: hypothetical protein M0R50_12280 [Candidatus Cloacimonetes bacterium]|jgi:hypothetical protein|nr:hypothetical protein [Candidatus Cloacimonadota bacterium]